MRSHHPAPARPAAGTSPVRGVCGRPYYTVGVSALYLGVCLLFAAALLLFLLRPGVARPLVVWGVAALLPLLAALASALQAQAGAARVLGRAALQGGTVTINNGFVTRTVTLAPQDAACLERAVRLRSRVNFPTTQGPILLNGHTTVTGPLPPSAVVEALTLRGELDCAALRAAPEPTP